MFRPAARVGARTVHPDDRSSVVSLGVWISFDDFPGASIEDRRCRWSTRPTAGLALYQEGCGVPRFNCRGRHDNGSLGTRKVRFETGRLARQAAGSAVAYLDDGHDPLRYVRIASAEGAVRLLPAYRMSRSGCTPPAASRLFFRREGVTQ
jgi:hypothetical protein